MEANVYFFAALVSTGIFLLQFILSIFFGSMDTDIDVNADGNADIDMSSVLSFKGLIHFCMGFGWFMYLCQPPYIVLHYLGAVISGSFFVFVLAWIYKLCYKRLSGNFWLVSFKISYLCLPLFYEPRTTPSCHPSGCAYRQL